MANRIVKHVRSQIRICGPRGNADRRTGRTMEWWDEVQVAIPLNIGLRNKYLML